MSAGPTAGARAPVQSRTRTCHGFFSLGKAPGAIYSSRREGDATVTIDIGAEGLVATGRMSAVQARSIARALLAAAEAVDAAQRRPQFVRSAEGGAA